jgi:hypothetical protein
MPLSVSSYALECHQTIDTTQVVFKALIVLHTMIRNGATDNVLSYLSSGEVLRLKNVSTGNWEGTHHCNFPKSSF